MKRSSVGVWLSAAAAAVLALGCMTGGEPIDFAEGEVLTPDLTVYPANGGVNVQYTGMSGGSQDWISIAPVGAGLHGYVGWAPTTGAAGTVFIPHIPAGGPYEARAYYDQTVGVLRQTSAPFSLMSSATISPDAGSYSSTATIHVIYSGVPAATNTWFSIAPQGSTPATLTNFRWNTSGTAAGTFDFPAPTSSGQYVLRVFRNGTYELVVESAAFTVTAATATVSTNASSYTNIGNLTVTYGNVPASTNTWFAIAPQGSTNSTITDFQWDTSATSAGNLTFPVPGTPGSYVVRVFRDGTYSLVVESAAFTVTNATSSATVSVPASLDQGANIPVTYSGFPGSGADWVAVADVGAPASSYYGSSYITGTSGTVTLPFSLAPGTYEVRGFFDWNSAGQRYVIRATSTFTIADTVSRVSISSTGVEGNGASTFGSISDGSTSGRYVAFVSGASTLVSGDTNGVADVFLRDRVSGTTTRVSVTSAGAESNGTSDKPRVSSDGRYVVFSSRGTNLASSDPNGFGLDVFVRDTVSGTTTCASVTSGGATGNDQSFYPSMTPDGRYVVFHSAATDLVSGDTNAQYDVFVRDTLSGTTERVSVNSAGAQSTGQSLFGRISDDGRYVVFVSNSADLVSGDTNGYFDVFVRDRTAGTTTRISMGTGGVEANSDSYAVPEISGNGNYVVFGSWARNLVSGDTNNVYDAFVWYRATNGIVRVSVASDGSQANAAIFTEGLGVSADGRYVVWSSTASNLVSGDTNGVEDVFLRDTATGTTTRLSVTGAGVEGNGASRRPLISSDGRRVAFESAATNLVSGDTNGQYDVFTVFR